MKARLVALASLAAAGPLILSGCASSSTSTAAASRLAPPALPTSVTTTDGTWATLPMGQLQDPDKTFWQLLYRPSGSTKWVDDVAATAVATNGGLALASSGSSLVAGALPAQNLTFSPLIRTVNGGASWTTGILPGGLAPVPDAMASGSDGSNLAIVGTAGDLTVYRSSTLSDWTPLVTQAQLAAGAAGRGCGVASLTAVAWAGPTPVVGGSCTTPGSAGIFVGSPGGGWRPAGPSIGPGPSEVLALRGVPAGVSALVESVVGSRIELAEVWSDPALQDWRQSSPLTIPAGTTVTSVVAAPGPGFTVLTTSAGGDPSVEEVAPPNGSWRRLPAPPAGTAGLATLVDGTVTALVPMGTTLVSSDLGPGAQTWVKTQTLNVSIQYGSSS